MKAINNFTAALMENGGFIDQSLLVPELKDTIDIYGDGLWIRSMDIFNAFYPTNTTSYFWEQHGTVLEAFTTTGGTFVAGTIGAPPAPVTFTLQNTPQNYLQPNNPDGSAIALAGTTIYPKLFDDVMIPGTEMPGRIVAINGSSTNPNAPGTPFAYTITVAPNDPTFAATIPAGATWFVIGHEEWEGGQNNGSTSNITYKMTANTITTDDAFTSTGRGLTLQRLGKPELMKLNIPVEGSDPHAYVLLELNDLYKRFLKKEEMKQLVDTIPTNTIVTTGNGTYPSTTLGHLGILPSIQQNGTIIPYSIVNGIQVRDFDLAILAMVKNRAPNSQWLWGSTPFNLGFDNMIKNFAPNGAINYASFEQSKMGAPSFDKPNFAKDIAFKWGFSEWGRGGFSFFKNRFEPFDDPDGLGANGYPYQNAAWGCPQGSRKDTKTGVNYKLLSFRYKANSIADRRMQLSVIGGAPLKGVKVQTLADNMTFQYRSDVGSQLMAPNQFFFFQGF